MPHSSRCLKSFLPSLGSTKPTRSDIASAGLLSRKQSSASGRENSAFFGLRTKVVNATNPAQDGEISAYPVITSSFPLDYRKDSA